MFYPPMKTSCPLLLTLQAISAAAAVTVPTKAMTTATATTIPVMAPDAGPEETLPSFAGGSWDDGPASLLSSIARKRLDRTRLDSNLVLCP